MINVDDWIFNTVQTELVKKIPNISMSSDYMNAPAALPHVQLTVGMNAVCRPMITLDNIENGAEVTLLVDVYSNSPEGKRSEAWAIMTATDEILTNLNFIRLDCSPRPMPNMESQIYRLNARYRARITKNNEIYRG